MILGLPIDVGNNAGSVECSSGSDRARCGGLNMMVFWQTLFCALALVVTLVLPFCLFYYEAVDEVEVLGKRTTRSMACLIAARCGALLLLAATPPRPRSPPPFPPSRFPSAARRRPWRAAVR